MKYTDQEIVDKFSKVDFDKTGLKKQVIYNRVIQAGAPRRVFMKKRKLATIVLVGLVAVFGLKYLEKEFSAPYQNLTPINIDSTSLAAASFGGDRSSVEAYVAAETVNSPAVSSEEVYFGNQSVDSYEADEVIPPSIPSSSARYGRTESRALGASSAGAAAADYKQSRESLSLIVPPAGSKYAAFRSARKRPQNRIVAEPAGRISQESKGYEENGFKKTLLEPLSTFSADVDTASYDMLKEQINRGWPIDVNGVRTEALINNFTYAYPEPQGNDPVSITLEYATAPWNEKNQLVKIGVKAKELDRSKLPQSHLVFLIDVSGSMGGEERLPLVKKSFKMLLNQLDKNDLVSIVTYASGVEVKLDGVKAKNKQKIVDAIDSLVADGSTYGEAGLKRAYEIAKKNFLRKGNNRIIIASDGDFNVGNSSVSALEQQVSQAKESGVFISALGFGMGNYRDHMMETIADKGNGNYAYISDLKSAQKALVREFGGTMFTVAKDVKFQVEFNPALVEEYRLIGYEKRLLANEDFNDDTKDAGEMGPGHTVTVFYEIRPKGSAEKINIDPLKYTRTETANNDEVLTVKMRYKDPKDSTSKLISKALRYEGEKSFGSMPADFRFAAAAAAFGQFVRDGKFLNGMSVRRIGDIASRAKGEDESGDRAEFVKLIRTYADTPDLGREDFANPASATRCGPHTRCL